MNKLVAIFTLCGVVGISGLFANSINIESVNPKSNTAQTLSQNDMEFLFGTSKTGNLNLRVLSKEELEETKGMWLPAMLAYEAGTGFIAGVGWYLYDISPEAEIDLGDAFISGLKGVGTSIVFGHLGFVRFIK